MRTFTLPFFVRGGFVGFGIVVVIAVSSCNVPTSSSPDSSGSGGRGLAERIQSIRLSPDLPGSLAYDNTPDDGAASRSANATSLSVGTLSASRVEPEELPLVRGPSYNEFAEPIESNELIAMFEALQEVVADMELTEGEVVRLGSHPDPLFDEENSIDFGVLQAFENESENLDFYWRFERRSEAEDYRADYYIHGRADFTESEPENVEIAALVEGFEAGETEPEGVGLKRARVESDGSYAFVNGGATGATTRINRGVSAPNELRAVHGSVYIPYNENDWRNVRGVEGIEDVQFTAAYGNDSFGGVQGSSLHWDTGEPTLNTEYYNSSRNVVFLESGTTETVGSEWLTDLIENTGYNVAEYFDTPPERLYLVFEQDQSQRYLFTGSGEPESVPGDPGADSDWTPVDGRDFVYRSQDQISAGDVRYDRHERVDINGERVTTHRTGYVVPEPQERVDGREYYIENRWPLGALRIAENYQDFAVFEHDEHENQYWLSTEDNPSELPAGEDDFQIPAMRERFYIWNEFGGIADEQFMPVLSGTTQKPPDYFDFVHEDIVTEVEPELYNTYSDLAAPFGDVDYVADFLETLLPEPNPDDFPDLP